ncbi:MAG TPA: hypothetical protein VFL82_01325 [Thermomicrobiales bacterium]|jgi:hypothetical protein|nr:hypothetical protein [Thermomicrobiales bacterium]
MTEHFETPRIRPEEVGQNPRDRPHSHGILRWVWQAIWSEAMVVIVGLIFLAIILWFAFVR